MIDVVVLFFLLGVFAGLARSELKLPVALYDSLSVFLMIAIGLKGGEGLAKQSLLPLLPQIGVVIILGVAQTLISYMILLNFGRFARVDAAATAAHYGSVSVATFAVGVNWLVTRNIDFEPQMAVLLTVMEVPAIMVGIILAKGVSLDTHWHQLARETFLGKGVVLLLGGVAIGWLAGPEGLAPIKNMFFDGFKGALALFLLEMGLIVSRQASELKARGLFLVCFGILMPLMSAFMGLGCGLLMDFSVGGLTLLATLAASASYIAVPAAIRLAVPAANPGLSLASVLGVTFPFNILVGIPLYHFFATTLLGG